MFSIQSLTTVHNLQFRAFRFVRLFSIIDIALEQFNTQHFSQSVVLRVSFFSTIFSSSHCIFVYNHLSKSVVLQALFVKDYFTFSSLHCIRMFCIQSLSTVNNRQFQRFHFLGLFPIVNIALECCKHNHITLVTIDSFTDFALQVNIQQFTVGENVLKQYHTALFTISSFTGSLIMIICKNSHSTRTHCQLPL